jgi:hypothetical protein
MDFLRNPFAALLELSTFMLLIILVFWLVKGYALYLMAKSNGIEKPWLSFIPFGMQYIQGCLTGNVTLFGVPFDCKLVLPIGLAAVMMPLKLPFIGIVYAAFHFIALYKFYLDRKAESAVMYLVLSIAFFGVAESIIFYILSLPLREKGSPIREKGSPIREKGDSWGMNIKKVILIVSVFVVLAALYFFNPISGLYGTYEYDNRQSITFFGRFFIFSYRSSNSGETDSAIGFATMTDTRITLRTTDGEVAVYSFRRSRDALIMDGRYFYRQRTDN